MNFMYSTTLKAPFKKRSRKIAPTSVHFKRTPVGLKCLELPHFSIAFFPKRLYTTFSEKSRRLATNLENFHNTFQHNHVFSFFIKISKKSTRFLISMLNFQSKARKPPKWSASFENLSSFTRLCAFAQNPKIWTWVFNFDVRFSIKSALSPKMKCKL